MCAWLRAVSYDELPGQYWSNPCQRHSVTQRGPDWRDEDSPRAEHRRSDMAVQRSRQWDHSQVERVLRRREPMHDSGKRESRDEFVDTIRSVHVLPQVSRESIGCVYIFQRDLHEHGASRVCGVAHSEWRVFQSATEDGWPNLRDEISPALLHKWNWTSELRGQSQT